MKSLLRNTLINSLSLYLLTLIFEGVKVSGGLPTYLFGGLTLALMFSILKPLISIVSLPLNIITMGTFSFLINAFIFYLATQLVGNIAIKGFTYPGISIAGFVVPKITFNVFFAYVTAALFQSVFVSLLKWLRK